MKRRDFLGAAATAGVSGMLLSKSFALPGQAGPALSGDAKWDRSALEALLSDCRAQLFERYLPFWEQGGYDKKHGGFMCYLYEDGSVENDRNAFSRLFANSFASGSDDPGTQYRGSMDVHGGSSSRK
jgi:hypothetical protein